MSHLIDLRSDTVTRPTPAMRRAMAEAEVGDDVYGEDPTVNQLEERVAALLGKEAALYVPSGTMGNLVAVLTHCGRGDELILGDKAHIFLYERGGSAALGGVHPRTLPNLPDGTLDLDQVADGVGRGVRAVVPSRERGDHRRSVQRRLREPAQVLHAFTLPTAGRWSRSCDAGGRSFSRGAARRCRPRHRRRR